MLTQIGFIVLVGLACKNAILIVEFARERVEHGLAPLDAAIEACRLRLRPILMTSFAFIMGVIPLVTASGAGSEMRQAIGIAVFSGMLGVTFFGLFLTPVFFVTIETWLEKRRHVGLAPPPAAACRSDGARTVRNAHLSALPRRPFSRAVQWARTIIVRRRRWMRISRTPASPAWRRATRVERYWTGFADPLLNGLVDDALAHNKDLGVAAANLQAARAARRLAGFDQFPTVTLAGGYTPYTRIRSSSCPASTGRTASSTRRRRGFDGLWELDLFGRVRRNVEAARADVGASAATLQDARVSVIAEVARDYFILRGLQDQLALTLRNADNQLSHGEADAHPLGGGPRQRTRHLARRGAVADHAVLHPDAAGIDRHHHLSLERADRPAAHGVG